MIAEALLGRLSGTLSWRKKNFGRIASENLAGMVTLPDRLIRSKDAFPKITPGLAKRYSTRRIPPFNTSDMAITNTRTTNRQRILDATIDLMNEKGGAVGTSQIAAHLGISPGNLYYHFANREEILRELLDLLSRDLDDVLRVEAGEAIPVERLASCYIGGTKVLWRYRFFFASAIDFVGRDSTLWASFQEFSRRSKTYMRFIIQSAVKGAPGSRVPSPNECTRLAETMWVLWVSWPRYSELTMPRQNIGEADIGRGLEQIAFVLSPYLDASYYQKVLRQVHRFVAKLKQDKG